MIIKIGQLSTAIITVENRPVIRLGVESTINKYAPLLGEPLDFHNVRKIQEEQWLEALAVLQLTDLFYDEKSGLFRKDGDISPLFREHLDQVNHAYEVFSGAYKQYLNTNIASVGVDGKLTQLIPAAEYYIGGHLKWMRFWMDYAIKFCSKPVIANVEYMEVGKAILQ